MPLLIKNAVEKKSKKPLVDRLKEIERENSYLKQKLKKAEIIIDVQKKFRNLEHRSTPERRQELMDAVIQLGEALCDNVKPAHEFKCQVWDNNKACSGL